MHGDQNKTEKKRTSMGVVVHGIYEGNKQKAANFCVIENFIPTLQHTLFVARDREPAQSAVLQLAQPSNTRRLKDLKGE